MSEKNWKNPQLKFFSQNLRLQCNFFPIRWNSIVVPRTIGQIMKIQTHRNIFPNSMEKSLLYLGYYTQAQNDFKM